MIQCTFNSHGVLPFSKKIKQKFTIKVKETQESRERERERKHVKHVTRPYMN